MMSFMLCTNWVCAGTFADHEWVSARTIIEQEEEILSMELDFKIDDPCVVQWGLLWFSASANLNRILGHEWKIKKCHEVVNSCTASVENTHRGRACCHRWQESYTVHTGGGE